jgi:uncharacterized integral membrane protein
MKLVHDLRQLVMRQINSVLIFVICLALVLFSIQNTDPVVIHFIQDVQFQAPLAVELLIAMGLGALMAWVFTVWSRFLRLIESGRELRQRDKRIRDLEQDVERYKTQIEELKLEDPTPRLPSSAEDLDESEPTDSSEAFAQ